MLSLLPRTPSEREDVCTGWAMQAAIYVSFAIAFFSGDNTFVVFGLIFLTNLNIVYTRRMLHRQHIQTGEHGVETLRTPPTE